MGDAFRLGEPEVVYRWSGTLEETWGEMVKLQKWGQPTPADVMALATANTVLHELVSHEQGWATFSEAARKNVPVMATEVDVITASLGQAHVEVSRPLARD